MSATIFVVVISGLLITEDDHLFRILGSIFLGIGSCTFLVWTTSFFIVAFERRVVSWCLFRLKYSNPFPFLYTISSAVGFGLFVSFVVFESLWAILGMFLDPNWAIPLVSAYIAFGVHAYVWLERIFYIAVIFRERATVQLIEGILKSEVKKKLNSENIKSFLKYLLDKDQQLIILGIQIDKQYVIQLLDELTRGTRRSDTSLINELLQKLNIDPQQLTNEKMLQFLEEMDKMMSSNEFFSKEFFEIVWERTRSVVQHIQQELRLSSGEMFLVASAVTVIFVASVVFVGWSFNQITMESIGLSIVKVIVMALFALGSKLVSYLKTERKKTRDEMDALIKALGGDLIDIQTRTRKEMNLPEAEDEIEMKEKQVTEDSDDES